MKKGFQKFLVWLYVTTYFRHIYVSQKCHTSSANILILSHRNGAVDGFVYYYAFKKGIFLLAKQLQRNPFLRFIFPGISIYRPQDKTNAAACNTAAIRECFNVLKKQKESLYIFPEGTSSLGPKHLPFHNGYAKMALINTSIGNQTTLLPVAIIYDDPTHLGGSVWIIPGDEIVVSKKMKLETIQERSLKNFENVVLSYADEKSQTIAHQTALIAALSKKVDYYEVLKRIEPNNQFASLIRSYNRKVSPAAFKYKHTVIYPQSLFGSLWTFLITCPIVVPTLMANFIPVLVGYFAGKTRHHDPNTISLWRSLIGYPTALLFYLSLAFISPWIALGSLLFSIWGFHLYGAFKKHLYALLNYIFYKSGYTYFRKVQNEIISKI